MSYGHLSEQEQLEQLKKWWSDYGASIIIGALLAVVISLAWHFYQNQKDHDRMEASLAYEQLLGAVEASDADKIQRQAQFIHQHYLHTAYASFALFVQAKQAAEQKRFDDAAKYLKTVIAETNALSLRQIARLRLARILIATNQAALALDTLQTLDDPHYEAMVHIVRADAYLSLGKKQQARDSYQQGLNKLPKDAMIVPLLQMKIDDLAG
jgi:predicted negative regulator of RcsB-dependent stress response